ncbi:MAG: GNAT family N-acetyltransferase [Fuerstiella sp.]|nr:GNAT family N-acetyltransferase [Fuerstiella sp.]
MSATAKHYKRLRMQIDLQQTLEAPALPDGYRFVPWQPLVQERHAQVQWRAFRNDVDGRLFNCLSNLAGCRRLLGETVNHAQFFVSGTWLVKFQPEPVWPADDCAMIQGLVRTSRTGAIQNLGVVPEHRGFGIGRALLLKTLHAYQSTGVRTATLEVTANNQPAVRLYLKLGFQVVRVLYRTAKAGSVVRGSERRPYELERRVPVVG